MNERSMFALSITVAWLFAGEIQGAEPLYPNTWYSASAPQPHPYLPGYNFSGPLYPQSPKYFQPGYGYVIPTAPFSSSLRFYSQNYAYGAVAYGSPYGAAFGPGTFTSPNSLFGTNGVGQPGGLDSMTLMHNPWFFPGSPANDRQFLLGW